MIFLVASLASAGPVEDARAKVRACTDDRCRGPAINALGLRLFEADQLEEAIGSFTRALALAEGKGAAKVAENLVRAEVRLALRQRDAGKLGKAETLLDAAVEHAAETGNARMKTTVHAHRAMVRLERREADPLDPLKVATDLREGMVAHNPLAGALSADRVWSGLANLYQLAGHLPAAVVLADYAVEEARDRNDTGALADALRSRGMLARAQNEDVKAKVLFDEALKVLDGIDAPADRAAVQQSRASWLKGRNKKAEYEAALRDALKGYDAAGKREESAGVRLVLAEHLFGSAPDEAVDILKPGLPVLTRDDSRLARLEPFVVKMADDEGDAGTAETALLLLAISEISPPEGRHELHLRAGYIAHRLRLAGSADAAKVREKIRVITGKAGHWAPRLNAASVDVALTGGRGVVVVEGTSVPVGAVVYLINKVAIDTPEELTARIDVCKAEGCSKLDLRYVADGKKGKLKLAPDADLGFVAAIY